jgi:hypothetical protein
MPTPTIPAGNLFMNATLYTGNGATLTVTNGAAGASFQPDFVWGKARSFGGSNMATDSVRGTNSQLLPDDTGAQTTLTNCLTAFNSNGFSLGSQGTLNNNTSTYVAWQWKAGGTAVTNTSGSISAQVSANTTSGFSIVTFTGTGANATVGHGLGAAPAMIMIKNRDSSVIGGAVYHTSIGATKYLKLFQTTTGTDGEATDNTAWNGSSPTFNTNVFSVGSLNRTNSSQQMVAYCWTPIAGYSAFGSYTGNGSTDGPFVYLGFRPKFVMIKQSSSSGNAWVMYDTSRNTYNVISSTLRANDSAAEDTVSGAGGYDLDILSNGFKVRVTWGGANTSGSTYIYMAFAENPFKYANAR